MTEKRLIATDSGRTTLFSLTAVKTRESEQRSALGFFSCGLGTEGVRPHQAPPRKGRILSPS